jgi:multidrug efflux pump subunit AcrA (membrane-fusion protein)
MFADIGLGTDPRNTVLIPANAVVHVGRSDYVLVGTEPGLWKVTEVKVGELHGSRVEILEGLKPGQQVIGSGAILLKPFIVEAVQQEKRPL